jgi:hypothetical protein
VRVTLSVQDVTAQMRVGLPSGQDGSGRAQAIDNRYRRLLAACESTPGHRCRIQALRGGDEYALIRQLEIRDVRVAYVPPAVVGELGGPGDDGNWPGHRTNFALLRVYVGPDGKPADSSELNVPLRPLSHLKLQAAGLASGDFAMAAGFPGRSGDGDRSLRVGFGNVRAVAASGVQRPVDFLVDFDLARGSSGWPVLNARAELVGLAFPADPGLIAAERVSDPAQLGGIAVDIRLVLSLLGAVDAGDRLLQELVVEPGAVDAG